MMKDKRDVIEIKRSRVDLGKEYKGWVGYA